MLSYVDKECTANDRSAHIVIAGDSPQELQGTDVSRMALEKAGQLGLSRPGVSNSTGAYPVDENGQTSDALCMGQGQVVGYRRDFDVRGGI
jgi:hypothetical protein